MDLRNEMQNYNFICQFFKSEHFAKKRSYLAEESYTPILRILNCVKKLIPKVNEISSETCTFYIYILYTMLK